MSTLHDPVTSDDATMVHTDNLEAMAAMPEGCVRLVVTSPPFADFFTYSNDEADLGNNRPEGFNLGWRMFTEQLLRVMAPGGVVVLHWTDLIAWGVKDGFQGLKDFGGRLHDAMEEAGFHLRAKISIEKDAQAVASRMHLHSIQFKTLHTDTGACFPIRSDYLYVFQKDGKAPPVTSFARGEITEEQWIEWARGVWRGQETDVLQVRGTGGEDDTKHVCPLQLWVIDRCVVLWSNPDELVYDPYGGVGSTGVVAMRRGRRYLGTELKPEYHLTAARNVTDEERAQKNQLSLLPGPARSCPRPHDAQGRGGMSEQNRVLTVKVRNYSIEVRGAALRVARGGDPAVEAFLRPLLIAALRQELHSVKIERKLFGEWDPFIEVCDCAVGDTRRSLMAVRDAAKASGFELSYDNSEPITGG